MSVAGYLGIAVTIFGLIALIVSAFRVNTSWGVISLLMMPISPLVFAITHWRVGRDGFILVVIGLLTISYATVTSDWWNERQYQKRLVLQQLSAEDQKIAEQDDSDAQLASKDTRQQIGSATPDTGMERKADPLANKAQQKAEQGNEATQPPVNESKEKVESVKSVVTIEKQTTTPPTTEIPAPTTDKSSTTAKQVEKKAVTQAPDAVARKKQVSSIPKTQPTTEPAKKSSAKILVYAVADLAKINSYVGRNVRVTDITNKVQEVVLKELHENIVVFEKLYGSGGSLTFKIPMRDIKKLEVGTWKAKQ